MEIRECIWLDEFVDKLIRKHRVSQDEVEEVFANKPDVRKVEDGDVKGEDLYTAFGRTRAGRYLSVFFIAKTDKRALVISARDMSKSERKRYARRK
jgi:uncharacterized protein